MAWILVGLVVVGMLYGNIAAALNISVMSKAEVRLYGSKVQPILWFLFS